MVALGPRDGAGRPGQIPALLPPGAAPQAVGCAVGQAILLKDESPLSSLIFTAGRFQGRLFIASASVLCTSDLKPAAATMVFRGSGGDFHPYFTESEF